MLRLTPTTITLTPGELQGLEHRRRFKSLLRRMSNIQIREDSPEDTVDEARELRVEESSRNLRRVARRLSNISIHEDSSVEEIAPADTADDGRGLRDEESTRGPLRSPNASSQKLNQHAPVATTQDEAEAGPSRLNSAIHEAAIAADLGTKTPHRRQRSHSNDVPQTGRQLSGSGPVLPPPFSTRLRAMTSTGAESLRPQRSTSSTIQAPSTAQSVAPLEQWMDELTRHAPREDTSPGMLPTMSVYDDSMPPMLQPQTPRHLPESRHRSQVNEPQATSSQYRVRNERTRSPHGHTLSRSRGSGANGFDGLYEGVENTDDEALYERSYGRRAVS